MNFAENCSFLIQDKAQGYHWTHQRSAVHPMLCYYKTSGDELEHESLCFLLEELKHGSTMVYQIQKMLMEYFQSKIPNLQHVDYFSDGSACEYKNKKSFYNLCNRYDDFGCFFTSH